MLTACTALVLRRTRVRLRLVVIAFFMLGDRLKMMVCGGDMAGSSEMVL